MKYLSVCSGIEAATVAWHGLGFEPVAFSEIEPFPSAVLSHHYPKTPNLGDIYKLNIDTIAKVLYNSSYGKQTKRIPRSGFDVRAWLVCSGCGGILWGYEAGNVGLAETEGRFMPVERKNGAGESFFSRGKSEFEEGNRDAGEGYFEEKDSPSISLPGVRKKLCSCEQPTSDRGTPLRLQQAFGCNLDVPPMSSCMAQNEYAITPKIDISDLDILVGGFPCQDLSVAGKRKGLKNEDGQPTRSGLFFRIMELADAIGQRWTILENVPGLLSSAGGNDFRAVVETMAGADVPLPKSGWKSGGMVLGPKGLVEWAILDAQNFGVPQRRRRVFIVRDSGNWRSRHPVLFEPESLCRDTPKGRKTGEEVAGSLKARANSGGWSHDVDMAASGYMQVAPSLRAQANASHRLDTEAYVPDVSPAIKARDYKGPSSDGDGDGAAIITAFHPLQDPISRSDGTTHALGCGSKTHGQASIAIAIAGNIIGRKPENGGNGQGFDETGAAYTLTKTDLHAVAFTQNQSGDVLQSDICPSMGTNQNATGRNTPKTLQGMSVRRLTPRECERLQAFPDDWTLIPWRKGMAPDGPRYKALGNSMCVNVVRWLGERILNANSRP